MQMLVPVKYLVATWALLVAITAGLARAGLASLTMGMAIIDLASGVWILSIFWEARSKNNTDQYEERARELGGKLKELLKKQFGLEWPLSAKSGREQYWLLVDLIDHLIRDFTVFVGDKAPATLMTPLQEGEQRESLVNEYNQQRAHRSMLVFFMQRAITHPATEPFRKIVKPQ